MLSHLVWHQLLNPPSLPLVEDPKLEYIVTIKFKDDIDRQTIAYTTGEEFLANKVQKQKVTYTHGGSDRRSSKINIRFIMSLSYSYEWDKECNGLSF